MTEDSTNRPVLECSFPQCTFAVEMDGGAMFELSHHRLTEHQGVDP